MEVKKVGQYPETRCTDTWIKLPFGGKTKGVPKCTVTWSDILTKVPVFWEEETSFVVKIPEFTWDTTEIVMHLPDIEMAADPDSLPWRNSNFITGVEAMPVRFTPTERVGASA